MSVVRVGVHGACGRMGRRVVAAVHAHPDVALAAALESSHSKELGNDIGEVCGLGDVGVQVSAEMPKDLDAVIDFSVPEASLALAERCAEQGTALLVATTGFSAEDRERLMTYAERIPLMVAANCSLVVNVLMKLAADTAKIFRGRDFDAEIIERHHRYKVDAPSGTALKLAEIVEEGMGLTERVYGREGITGERPRNQLGVHALRTGDNVGEHTVVFSTLGETLELVHKGSSRDSYVSGAVAAAAYLAGKAPGEYGMADVLGF
ncbi:4-hydroxy-tetrahydrodipicolinate reductase [Planctomycetes bacterium Pan216]|uniref:4-hydroxy-tetrahydrodipicolinate reductase n=1 Tax=Kolteria novifilia TaxID=2527975 RepID=A0A518AZ97_9BACT|nr:4-hydroxy-tetrahydrodipicolinate reductase [Planctomycetes bacterium Pan216]